MDVKTASSATFNEAAVLAKVKGQLDANKERAAAYALAELIKVLPVRTGAMKASAGVVLTEKGFELYVRKYYAYFLEQGWHVGARRAGEARAARRLAKDIRSARKMAGSFLSDADKLKALEKELRQRAKKIDAANAARRRFRPGSHAIENSVKTAIPGVIERIAGRA